MPRGPATRTPRSSDTPAHPSARRTHGRGGTSRRVRAGSTRRAAHSAPRPVPRRKTRSREPSPPLRRGTCERIASPRQRRFEMGKRIVHVEFPAQDIDRGQKFWEGVGGWSLNDDGMPGGKYLMFQEGDAGGAVYKMDDFPASGTTIYLGTDEIDADIAKVRELGGEAD